MGFTVEDAIEVLLEQIRSNLNDALTFTDRELATEAILSMSKNPEAMTEITDALLNSREFPTPRLWDVVFVARASDETFDRKYIGKKGVVVGVAVEEYGIGESEGDPVIRVMFPDGTADLFWKEELDTLENEAMEISVDVVFVRDVTAEDVGVGLLEGFTAVEKGEVGLVRRVNEDGTLDVLFRYSGGEEGLFGLSSELVKVYRK